MDGESSTSLNDHTFRVQQLFVRHQRSVLAYILTMEPQLEEAEEIVQETFLTVSRKAAEWVDGTNFSSWVRSIARFNTLHSQRTRSRRTARFADDLVELIYEEDTPIDEFSDCERDLAALARCMDRLAPRAKQLIELRYQLGKLPEQIALVMGWSVNSVRVALTRAKIALRECLNRELASGAKP